MDRKYKPKFIIPDEDLDIDDIGNQKAVIRMFNSGAFVRGWWETAKEFLRDPRIIELVKQDKWDEIFECWGTEEMANDSFGINTQWCTAVIADILYWLGFNFWDYLEHDDDYYIQRYDFKFEYEDK